LRGKGKSQEGKRRWEMRLFPSSRSERKIWKLHLYACPERDGRGRDADVTFSRVWVLFHTLYVIPIECDTPTDITSPWLKLYHISIYGNTVVFRWKWKNSKTKDRGPEELWQEGLGLTTIILDDKSTK
jgi:hypothetical protein